MTRIYANSTKIMHYSKMSSGDTTGQTKREMYIFVENVLIQHCIQAAKSLQRRSTCYIGLLVHWLLMIKLQQRVR